MTFLDFFAGIGGFRVGMEIAGHECVGFCEWDAAATRSYVSMHLLTDAQRERLAVMPMRQRQEEIAKEEYKNGEWYSNDIRTVNGGNVPRAECWCFGAPCQSFSLAGKRAGLEGESGLVNEIFRILGEIEPQGRPQWLVYENVAGMFSSNEGYDYAVIFLAMDELGYDAEWQVFNSKHFGVPQNRERVYTLGHLRGRGATKIFPLKGADGKNQVQVGVSLIGNRAGYRRNLQTFSPNGVTEALSTSQGGGRGHHVALKLDIPLGVIDPQGRRAKENEVMNEVPTLRAQTHGNEPLICYAKPFVYDDYNSNFRDDGISCTLTTNCGSGARRNGQKVCVPVDCDEKEEHPGTYVTLPGGVTAWAVWYEKYGCYIVVRKLTPRECFRLQGFSDEYFNRAASVNSDSQLYKQSGNSVTTNVVYEIAKALAEAERNGDDAG